MSNTTPHDNPTGQADPAALPLHVDRDKVGILEWFRPGETDHVERTLAWARQLGVRFLRTGMSWADWYRPGVTDWYDWLWPKLARQLEVMPCLVHTPPTLGREPRVSSPPRDLQAYADWCDQMLTRYGAHFEYLELWNEPNNLSEWDFESDYGWEQFAEMIGSAAHWIRKRGWKTVLAGMSPTDINFLRIMFDRGVMEYIDVVGLHGFPATFDVHWPGWKRKVREVREALDANGCDAPIWITETGFSMRRHEPRLQLEAFADAVDAPAERVYWYAMQDLDPELPALDGFHLDEREYHFGLKRPDGRSSLLYRLWRDGDDVLNRCIAAAREPAAAADDKPIVITGGAGFVGTNLAHRLLSQGRSVVLFDNLSRSGVEQNLQWLKDAHGPKVRLELADVRDPYALRRVVTGAEAVYHLAAQVAVTTSLTDPQEDFAVNAGGTLNLLEAIRRCSHPPMLLFTSTNKVYGGLSDVHLRKLDDRYGPVDAEIAATGIGEDRPLDFHSPYGCSKGSADQYVIDYARTFGLQAIIFRMSCIYGPHQFGNEDQGWVAHFLARTLDREGLTIFGDGRQVRDILFVEELVDAMLLAMKNMARLSGRAFNIGGGPSRSISLLELLDRIEIMHGARPRTTFEDWRPGDQRYYVSDVRSFSHATGWKPQVTIEDGLLSLYNWLRSTRGLPPASGARRDRTAASEGRYVARSAPRAARADR